MARSCIAAIGLGATVRARLLCVSLVSLVGLGGGVAGAFVGAASADDSSPRTYLRLIDPLDRPDDGYCLDVLGSGDVIRLDMPLTAHNCKPGYYTDEGVTLGPDGTLVFPAYEGCVTAMGVNAHALPGASLMLKACGGRSAFLENERMQRFDLADDGRVTLAGTELCLTVGAQSAATFDPTHRWRALFLAECGAVKPARARWHLDDRG